MTIWFTSDTHFGHRFMLTAYSRPYSCVEEMDESIIKNWNDRVSKGDIIYHLGDLSFSNVGKTNSIINRLNGEKYLIIGNHDKRKIKKYEGFGWIKQAYELKHQGQHIWMQHFPCRSWEKSSYGSWHLFGHCHGHAMPWGKSCDVGVDCWDMAPVSFETISELMGELEPTPPHHRDTVLPWKGRQLISPDVIGEKK